MERTVRGSSSSSSSALQSHAAQAAFFTFLLSLAGLAVTLSALAIKRAPLLYSGAILVAGIVFVMTGGLLSRWFRKYGRRRSRHGNLARGQALAMFAFLAWLLEGFMFLVHFGLAAAKWKGF